MTDSVSFSKAAGAPDVLGHMTLYVVTSPFMECLPGGSHLPRALHSSFNSLSPWFVCFCFLLCVRVHMWMWTAAGVPWYTCGGQRATLESRFFPYTVGLGDQTWAIGLCVANSCLMDHFTNSHSGNLWRLRVQAHAITSNVPLQF